MRVVDTAVAIARVRADEARLREEERLFSDPYAELFAEDATSAGVSQMFEALPYFREHVRLRTRFIDDFVRDAVERGTQQVVLVGAGFDCRALRLPELAQASVFEIDLAEQLAKKARILAEAGHQGPPGLRSVPANLAEEDLVEALERHGYRPAAGSAFVAEGIAGYLDRPALERLAARSLGAGAHQLVINYSSAAWSPEHMAQVFEEAGWAHMRQQSYSDLHRKLIGAEPGVGHDRYFILVASSARAATVSR